VKRYQPLSPRMRQQRLWRECRQDRRRPAGRWTCMVGVSLSLVTPRWRRAGPRSKEASRVAAFWAARQYWCGIILRTFIQSSRKTRLLH